MSTSAITSAQATAILGVPARVSDGGWRRRRLRHQRPRLYPHHDHRLHRRAVVLRRSQAQDAECHRQLGGHPGSAHPACAAGVRRSRLLSLHQVVQPGGAGRFVVPASRVVYRNGRMLRPIATGPGPGKLHRWRSSSRSRASRPDASDLPGAAGAARPLRARVPSGRFALRLDLRHVPATRDLPADVPRRRARLPGSPSGRWKTSSIGRLSRAPPADRQV